MPVNVDMGTNAPRLRFGAFVLDMRRAELAHEGTPVALRPKALALLSLLSGQSGRAVSKEELLAALWPGVVVTDDSLTQCVAELRMALGDRGGQTFIRTLPRLGYRFDAPVQVLQDEAAAGAAGTTAPRGRWPFAAAGVGLAMLAAAAALAPVWRGAPPPQQRIDAELASRRSIAVLPFTDRSATPTAHFAEAVVEEILTDVARMRDTLVIASGTTRALAARGQTDPEQVGRELGVQFVLGGSLRRDGERLQVHVQLSRAAGGALLWSERFDYADASGWNWRRDVSERVAGTLDVKMHEAALDRQWHVGRSSEAMDQWMRGAHLVRHYKTREEVLRAREHFEAALAADPRSVNALIGLAQTHHTEVLRRWRMGLEQADSLQRAKAHVLAALAIDPNHAGAMAALGVIHSFGNEFKDAEQVLAKALALNPNDANAHRDLAGLKLFTGRFEDVPAHVAAALRLNPLESFHVWQCHSIMGTALSYMNQEAAGEHFRLAALAEPTHASPHGDMAAHAAMQGRLDEARVHLAEALRLAPGYTIARSVAGDRSRHPRYLAGRQRQREGLRLAGLPEGMPVASPIARADASIAPARPPIPARSAQAASGPR